MCVLNVITTLQIKTSSISWRRRRRRNNKVPKSKVRGLGSWFRDGSDGGRYSWTYL